MMGATLTLFPLLGRLHLRALAERELVGHAFRPLQRRVKVAGCVAAVV